MPLRGSSVNPKARRRWLRLAPFLPRDAADAYNIARRHGYVDVHSDGITEWVAELLGISVRWAYEVAQKDIKALQAAKKATVLEALAEGKSVRAAALAAGISKSAAHDWAAEEAAVQKVKTAKSGQPAAGDGEARSEPRKRGGERRSKPSDEARDALKAAAKRKKAEAKILHGEEPDPDLDPEEVLAIEEQNRRWKAEEAARKAHGNLVRALDKLLALPGPREMRAHGYTAVDCEIAPRLLLTTTISKCHGPARRRTGPRPKPPGLGN